MSSRLDCTLALVALLRAFHKECEGCPVEELCDQAEALVNVAEAAQEAEDHAQDYWDWVTHYQPKLREALAALDKADGK